jgi:geranylgeranyl diphosphate synthase type I
MSDTELFSRYQEATVPVVEQMMLQYCQELLPSEYHNQKAIINYHFNWDLKADEKNRKGKRLRPLMLLLATESVGGTPEKAMPAASAVEFIHNFSLIHDDIEDHDEFRHGKESIWMKYGVEIAINAGDALFSLAFLSLGQLEGEDKNILELLGILSSTCAKLTGGQDMDLGFERADIISLDNYLLMVQGKTVSLFEACCSMGSILGGGSLNERQSLTRFGKKLGLAFQVRDDWLGLWGDPEKTGKKRGSDIFKAKWTFPILYAAQTDASYIDEIRKGKGMIDAEEVVRNIASTGANEYTIGYFNRLLDEAVSELDNLETDTQANLILRSLIEIIRKV